MITTDSPTSVERRLPSQSAQETGTHRSQETTFIIEPIQVAPTPAQQSSKTVTFQLPFYTVRPSRVLEPPKLTPVEEPMDLPERPSHPPPSTDIFQLPSPTSFDTSIDKLPTVLVDDKPDVPVGPGEKQSLWKLPQNNYGSKTNVFVNIVNTTLQTKSQNFENIERSVIEQPITENESGNTETTAVEQSVTEHETGNIETTAYEQSVTKIESENIETTAVENIVAENPAKNESQNINISDVKQTDIETKSESIEQSADNPVVTGNESESTKKPEVIETDEASLSPVQEGEIQGTYPIRNQEPHQVTTGTPSSRQSVLEPQMEETNLPQVSPIIHELEVHEKVCESTEIRSEHEPTTDENNIPLSSPPPSKAESLPAGSIDNLSEIRPCSRSSNTLSAGQRESTPVDTEPTRQTISRQSESTGEQNENGQQSLNSTVVGGSLTIPEHAELKQIPDSPHSMVIDNQNEQRPASLITPPMYQAYPEPANMYAENFAIPPPPAVYNPDVFRGAPDRPLRQANEIRFPTPPSPVIIDNLSHPSGGQIQNSNRHASNGPSFNLTCEFCGGLKTEKFTALGITLGILCFPCGLFCCFKLKQSRCKLCGR